LRLGSRPLVNIHYRHTVISRLPALISHQLPRIAWSFVRSHWAVTTSHFPFDITVVIAGIPIVIGHWPGAIGAGRSSPPVGSPLVIQVLSVSLGHGYLPMFRPFGASLTTAKRYHQLIITRHHLITAPSFHHIVIKYVTWKVRQGAACLARRQSRSRHHQLNTIQGLLIAHATTLVTGLHHWVAAAAYFSPGHAVSATFII